MADAGAVHADKVAVDKAVPAPADADALDAHSNGGPNHCPDGGIHARGISAAGQHADPFDVAAHIPKSSFWVRLEKQLYPVKSIYYVIVVLKCQADRPDKEGVVFYRKESRTGCKMGRGVL